MYVTKHEGGYDNYIDRCADGLKLVAPNSAATNPDGNIEFSLDTRFVNLGYQRKDNLSHGWEYRTTRNLLSDGRQ